MKYTIFIIALLSFPTLSQNLEKLGDKENRASVSGGLQLNTITYFQSGLVIPNREPFTWFASGNLNITILDVALPFTFTYSNQGGAYTQPFNRTAFHPSYKWAKAHLGLVSMNFSPYTLSGHLFLGGALELTPGNWNIQMMGGRLNKKVEYNSIDDNIDDIVFNRWGYGLNVGYSDKGYEGKIILFKGQDDPKSLSFMPVNSEIKPQDNLIISAAGKAKIIKSLSIEGEYALTGLTNNRNSIEESTDVQNFKFLHPIISGNATTNFYQAFKTILKYSHKTVAVSFNFEHIDPGYKTLGGYFFNNDLNNFTLAPSFSLFKKKLNIAMNTGFQVNNLSKDKSATTKRWVGSVNTSYSPVKRMVINGSYSNFSTFTRNRPNTDPFYYAPADTLNFYQLTQSASGMLGYSFGGDTIQHALQLIYNYQESSNLTGNIQTAGAFGTGLENNLPTGILTKIHSGNIAYSLQLSKSGASITLASNINRTSSDVANSTFLGPTINFNKSVFEKKGNLSVGSTYNQQFASKEMVGNVFNHRVSFNFTPKMKQKDLGQISFSLNGNLMQRLLTGAGSIAVNEMNIFINLGYNF